MSVGVLRLGGVGMGLQHGCGHSSGRCVHDSFLELERRHGNVHLLELDGRGGLVPLLELGGEA